jgi:hypothetical protein
MGLAILLVIQLENLPPDVSAYLEEYLHTGNSLGPKA